jgi:hypothetical protein
LALAAERQESAGDQDPCSAPASVRATTIAAIAWRKIPNLCLQIPGEKCFDFLQDSNSRLGLAEPVILVIELYETYLLVCPLQGAMHEATLADRNDRISLSMNKKYRNLDGVGVPCR